MGLAIRAGKFGIPPPAKLPMKEKFLPHVILGDEAFAKHGNLINLIAIAIYNYRHCRARKIVEKAFAQLSNTFRLFHKPTPVSPAVVDLVCSIDGMHFAHYVAQIEFALARRRY